MILKIGRYLAGLPVELWVELLRGATKVAVFVFRPRLGNSQVRLRARMDGVEFDVQFAQGTDPVMVAFVFQYWTALIASRRQPLRHRRHRGRTT